MKRGIGILLKSMVLFSGGVVAGLLISPGTGKENREWLQKNTNELQKWAKKTGYRLMDEGERLLNTVTGEFRNTVKKNLPDLYEATTDIQFDDDDIEHA